ncbi:MAG: hypothetical protein JJ992_26330, partial [Planctomycetes bacterium]|nr:hypothetical protein [Planctomycetota bacterium]
MLKRVLLVGLMFVIVADSARLLRSQELPCAAPPVAESTRRWAFDGNEALAGWTVTGDASLDMSKGREDRKGSLIIGPGSKATLRLRDTDGSGQIDDW